MTNHEKGIRYLQIPAKAHGLVKFLAHRKQEKSLREIPWGRVWSLETAYMLSIFQRKESSYMACPGATTAGCVQNMESGSCIRMQSGITSEVGRLLWPTKMQNNVQLLGESCPELVVRGRFLSAARSLLTIWSLDHRQKLISAQLLSITYSSHFNSLYTALFASSKKYHSYSPTQKFNVSYLYHLPSSLTVWFSQDFNLSTSTIYCCEGIITSAWAS